jgi:hypothetical protein
MAMVLTIIGLAIALTAFIALAWWSHKSERDIDYDKPGIPEDQANGLRFGIAISSSQGVPGGF